MSKGKKWNVAEATKVPSELDLAFAAGFMEGDGYFGKNKTTVSAEFNQKDEWIVRRFEEWFGGAVGQIHKQGISNGTYWRWRISGDRARNFMRVAYPLLSPKRQEQIDNSLGKD